MKRISDAVCMVNADAGKRPLRPSMFKKACKNENVPFVQSFTYDDSGT